MIINLADRISLAKIQTKWCFTKSLGQEIEGIFTHRPVELYGGFWYCLSQSLNKFESTDHSNDKDIANEANAENDAKGDRDKDSGQLLDHLLIRAVGQGW